MVITEVTPVLITDPKKRKELRDQMCAEYRRLTGVNVSVVETRRSITRYKYYAHNIVEIACRYHNLKVEDVLSKSRKAELVNCRQRMCHILNKIKLSIEQIRKIVEYKDHATVIYSIETVNGYLKVDKEYRKEYEKYKEYCIAELEKYVGTGRPGKRLLDDEQEMAIVASVEKGGIMRKELAEIYGVDPATISGILKRRTGNKKYKRK